MWWCVCLVACVWWCVCVVACVCVCGGCGGGVCGCVWWCVGVVVCVWWCVGVVVSGCGGCVMNATFARLHSCFTYSANPAIIVAPFRN